MGSKCDTSKPYVFLSYSSKDKEFILSEVEALETAGISVWIDKDDMDKTSPSWKDAAKEAITNSNRCLFIYYLSVDSLSSTPCREEIEFFNASKNDKAIVVSVHKRKISDLFEEAKKRAHSRESDEEFDCVRDIHKNFLTSDGAERSIYINESKEERIDGIAEYFRREKNRIEKWVWKRFNPESSQFQIEGRARESINRLSADGTPLCAYIDGKLNQSRKIRIECEKGSGKEFFCAQLIKYFQDRKDDVIFFFQGEPNDDSSILSQLTEQVCFRIGKRSSEDKDATVMQQFESSVIELAKEGTGKRNLIIVDYPDNPQGELFWGMMNRYYPDEICIIILANKGYTKKVDNAFYLTLTVFSEDEIRLLAEHYNKSINPSGIAKIHDCLNNSVRDVARFIKDYEDAKDFDSNWAAFSVEKENERFPVVRSQLVKLGNESKDARTFLELLAVSTDIPKTVEELDEVFSMISPEHESCYDLTEKTDSFFTYVSREGVSFKNIETRDFVLRATDRRKRAQYCRCYAEYYENYAPERISSIETYYFKAAEYDEVLRVMNENTGSLEESASFFLSLFSQSTEEARSDANRFFGYLKDRNLNEYVEPLLSALDQYLMQSGDYKVAESVLNYLPQDELTDNTKYSFIRSVICHKKGNLEEAQEIIGNLFHSGMEDRKKKVRILLRYAGYLREAGKTIEADSAYGQILELCGDNDNDSEIRQAFMRATLFVNDRKYLEGNLGYAYQKNEEAEKRCIENQDWDNLLLFYKLDAQILNDVFLYGKCGSIIKDALEYRKKIRNEEVLGAITILGSYLKNPKTMLAFLDDETVKALRFCAPIEYHKKFIAEASAYRRMNRNEDSLGSIEKAIKGFSELHYKSGEGRAWNEKAITLFGMGKTGEALSAIEQSERLLTREKGRMTQVVFHYRNRILRKLIENPDARPDASDFSDLPQLSFVEGTDLAGFVDNFVKYTREKTTNEK